MSTLMIVSSVYFNVTATNKIYTLSLHDALPISGRALRRGVPHRRRDQGRLHGAPVAGLGRRQRVPQRVDRKSTRLNSSHVSSSYAVFCLKKKKVIRQYFDGVLFGAVVVVDL